MRIGVGFDENGEKLEPKKSNYKKYYRKVR